jgi:hypothetical protein
MNKVMHIFITIMFIMMLTITCIIIVFAFYNHHVALISIRHTLGEIAGNPLLLVSQKDPNDHSSIDKVCTELKSVSDDIMDSNTVSFLFEVLLLSVVTVGAYLLFRSVETQKKIEGSVKEMNDKSETIKHTMNDYRIKITESLGSIKPFFESASNSLAVWSCYSDLRTAFASLEGVKGTEQTNLATHMLDSFKKLEDRLQEGVRNNCGYEGSIYNTFIDIAKDINYRLSKLSKTTPFIGEFLSRSERCLHMLTSHRFDERYETILSAFTVGEDIKN